MKVILFGNQKGGVAKTTSTYNIATQFAKMGYRTLMIDSDPQASLTIISGIKNPEDLETKNFSALINPLNPNKPDVNDCIYKVECTENLYIMPSDISLAYIERKLIGDLESGSVLKRNVIPKLSDRFDVVCIDSPPSLGLLTINAIAASDCIVGCVEPSFQSIRGIYYFVETVKEITDVYSKEANIAGIIVGRVGRGNDALDAIEYYKSHFEILGIIKQKVETINWETEGVPISIAKPNSVNAKEFKKIAEYLESKCDLRESKNTRLMT